MFEKEETGQLKERAGFLDEARKRKRKPVKRATLATWESCLEKYLNPEIGEEPLANINNGTLKRLVARLDSFGLSAKTIINYTGFMKLVVSSAVDENTGEPLYLESGITPSRTCLSSTIRSSQPSRKKR